MVTNADSFDKVVSTYFHALTKKPFTFKGKEYLPKQRLVISPLLLRGFTCPSECGGCCARVTLDYLPMEPHPEYIGLRIVEFNGKAYSLLSDTQSESNSPKCKHLRYEDGRCNIHNYHPMLCDVELLKFLHYDDHALLLSKLYGRGWALSRVDGKKGAKCEMLPVTSETITDIIRKLYRIRDWCIYFNLDSWIDDIIEWAQNYPSAQGTHLVLSTEQGAQLAHVE
jgi:hypothetical protein